MYKYLPITSNLQEMMVMLKSLPACTLVFDKHSNLVDINQPALRLFKTDNIQVFNERLNEIFPTHEYIKTIIQELKHGKTVRYARTIIKNADKSLAAVELCACMINGGSDLFLFQLFEMFPFKAENSGSFASYNKESEHSTKSSHPVVWVTNSNNILVMQKKKKIKLSSIKTDAYELKKLTPKKLTNLEMLIDELQLMNMSISQIAAITNKTTPAIRVMLHRIKEKQKINSRSEVNQVSMDYTPM